MEGLVIRKASPADAVQLLRLIEDLTRHHDDLPRLSLATLERDLFGAAPWFHVLVAEAGLETVAEAGAAAEARLSGYAALLPLARLGHGARGMDLHQLFVAEAQRGQGIGTALVRDAEALARSLDCTYLIIGTHPGNLAAQGFYQSLGYAPMANTAVRFSRTLG